MKNTIATLYARRIELPETVPHRLLTSARDPSCLSVHLAPGDVAFYRDPARADFFACDPWRRYDRRSRRAVFNGVTYRIEWERATPERVRLMAEELESVAMNEPEAVRLLESGKHRAGLRIACASPYFLSEYPRGSNATARALALASLRETYPAQSRAA